MGTSFTKEQELHWEATIQKDPGNFRRLCSKEQTTLVKMPWVWYRQILQWPSWHWQPWLWTLAHSFGAGRRLCLGMWFALTEMKMMILGKLLLEYEVMEKLGSRITFDNGAIFNQQVGQAILILKIIDETDFSIHLSQMFIMYILEIFKVFRVNTYF